MPSDLFLSKSAREIVIRSRVEQINGVIKTGSPETVARQVTGAVVDGEVNYVAGAFAWGSLDVETSLRSLRLFRDEVIPAVRQAARAS